MKKLNTKNIVLAAFFLALSLALPFLTAQIPTIGGMLLPMHIPVLICGFVCGGPLGLIVGALSPLLRSVMFGMPPMFPVATAMAFELATYGLLTGLLYVMLPKKTISNYITLIVSMLGGRIVWGLVTAVLYGMSGKAFSIAIFIAGAFTNAIPGIILQIILIPILIAAMQKAKYLK